MKNKFKLPRISFPGKWKDIWKEKTGRIREKFSASAPDGEMVSLSEKLKFHRSRVRMRTVLIIAAAVLLVGGYMIYRKVRVFHGCRVLLSTERSDDSATKYVRLKGRMLKCNPNGVTCVNDSNDVQWNVTFTLQDPVIDVCGTTVVVGDRGGKDVYVFDKDGQTGHFETEYTLTKVRVALQGVVAAVLEDGEVTWVNVYDSQGTVLVKNKTTMSESGYPVDVDISPDGQKMAVSYLGMDNNNVKTKIAFYNFSSVGKSKSDYLVNSVEYSGQVVPEISFLDGNYAAVFRDNGVTFFKGKQVPEQKTEITLEQEIISTFHNEQYVGIVTASDEEEQTHKYKMQIYRKDGRRCASKYFDLPYSEIAIDGDEIIMHSDHEVVIYEVNGNKKAEFTYEKQILDIIKLNGFRKYEVVTPDSTDRIRLK